MVTAMMSDRKIWIGSLVSGLFLMAAVATASSGSTGDAKGSDGPALPRPDHVVIVVMENKSYAEIIGSSEAPYINTLSQTGALLTQSYGVTHPSEPNYLALFSGSTQDVKNDSCPHAFTGPNLGSELLAAGFGFETFSEGLPSVGFTGCVHGRYYRKHNPAVNWQGANIPPEANRPLADFPSNYSRLPTVSLVIPDIVNDMHDGSIATGDKWLKDHLGGYIAWSHTHNSILILTWDEGKPPLFGLLGGNHIPTIIAGEPVRAGTCNRRVDHYDVLRTLLDLYGLPPIGQTAQAEPLSTIWR